jgi:hypothetical protein
MMRAFGFDGFVWAQPGADVLTTAIAVLLGLSLLRLLRDPDPGPRPAAADASSPTSRAGEGQADQAVGLVGQREGDVE